MSDTTSRVVAVTGAAGFLGSRLCARFLAAGWGVRALARAPRPTAVDPAIRWHKYVLPGEVDESVFDGPIEAVVHCAYDASDVGDMTAGHRTNVEGARHLIDLSRRLGVKRFVFVSSMSAHEGALSAYGMTKLAIEQLLDPGRDLCVRPGFIIGDGGVYLRLAQSIRRLPVIPLFYGGRRLIQTIAVDDVCEGIYRAVDRGLRGRLLLAAPDPVNVTDFYRTISRQLGVARVFVPFSGAIALPLLRRFEAAGVRLPFSSENLLGLKALKTFDVTADLNRVGLFPKTMTESLECLYGRHHTSPR